MQFSHKLKTLLLTSLAILTLATPMALAKPGDVIKTPESGNAKVHESTITPLMEEKLLFSADFDVTTHYQIKKSFSIPTGKYGLKIASTAKTRGLGSSYDIVLEEEQAWADGWAEVETNTFKSGTSTKTYYDAGQGHTYRLRVVGNVSGTLFTYAF
ncbi:hypothetical protein NST23_04040 [Brevibacillus sp. FSL K6-0770]|jgi:hypothetical protein|uniref:hypothetical protein n=1 Tax=unclassified Brevibacillus TaxID=2684853 RepID=UPI002473DCB0|nr:hypothetical protein [Brevibacillus sp. 1238]MDH6352791.1 hypothetical protein [Brevibacillus sp. 1238]